MIDAKIVFLSESLRSVEPLERLLCSRPTTELLTYMVNHGRTRPKYPVKNNSMCVVIRNVRRAEGNEDWTVNGWKQLPLTSQPQPGGQLTLTGVRVDPERKPEKRGVPIDSVLFEFLAVDVARMPQGYNALDLTRCVGWALNNPLTQEDLDEAVFQRWKEQLKNYKREIRVVTREMDEAEAAAHVVKTKKESTRVHEAWNDAEASLQAKEREGRPFCIQHTLVGGKVVVNPDLIPPPIPGPSPAVIMEYLAQFEARPAADATPSQDADYDLHMADVDMFPALDRNSIMHTAEDNVDIDMPGPHTPDFFTNNDFISTKPLDSLLFRWQSIIVVCRATCRRSSTTIISSTPTPSPATARPSTLASNQSTTASPSTTTKQSTEVSQSTTATQLTTITRLMTTNHFHHEQFRSSDQLGFNDEQPDYNKYWAYNIQPGSYVQPAFNAQPVLNYKQPVFDERLGSNDEQLGFNDGEDFDFDRLVPIELSEYFDFGV
ncbi:hypothetical protein EK21DRAFT_85604 [Setomelanomma holmii]|uniref:Uncharacterized protein n=1 Tax=Setomelanomma holmii TaxID=210430 RepID=A0A9P4LNR2_9PLEO|nr:hypothetical protein EK21DRAFT_85604 [Setomelanomma holmii]